MFDAHAHYHLAEPPEQVAALAANLQGVGLMATGDGDWDKATVASEAAPNARLMLGVHPWFAHRYEGPHARAEHAGWLDDLRRRVTSRPGTCVGEIGLDRQWRTPDTGEVEFESQLAVFRAQLGLAAELQLPVCVHCVRAQGHLAEALAAAPALPPAIYMHAFGGTQGTLEQLSRSKKYGDRVYFGFAACVNLRSPKTPGVIAAVPDDRLLLESDREACGAVEAELAEMAGVYAAAKGWSPEECVRRTTENAERFYGCSER